MEEVEDVAKVAFDYFVNIFSADTCDRMRQCLNTVNHKNYRGYAGGAF